MVGGSSGVHQWLWGDGWQQLMGQVGGSGEWKGEKILNFFLFQMSYESYFFHIWGWGDGSDPNMDKSFFLFFLTLPLTN